MYRSSVRRIGHPLAVGKAQRVAVHRMILWDKLRGAGAPCNWCQRSLVWRLTKDGADTLVADHLDGDDRNNQTDNLVPSCRGCNGNRTRRRQLRQCGWCQASFLPRRPETRFCSTSCSTSQQWADGRGWAS